MAILVNVLLWLHFMGLAGGGAASFGMPAVGTQMPKATPETRAVLFKVAHGLSLAGQIGMGVLIVTGLLMVWLKFGGVSGLSFWFWIKMVLVVALGAGAGFSSRLLRQAERGDVEAAKMMPRVGPVLTLLFLGIVFSAVMAFD